MWVDAQLVEIVSGIGPLETLEIQKAMGLSEQFFHELGMKHARSLKKLKLGNVRRMDDLELFNQVLPVARKLECLAVNGSIRLWARTMAEYSQFSGVLRIVELNVSHCISLPKEFFLLLPKTLPQLRILKARETCVDDEVVEALLLNPMNALQDLDIGACNQLSIKVWETLSKASFSKLKRLTVQGSRGVMEDEQAPRLAYKALQHMSLHLMTLSVGPILSGKQSFKGWCNLVNAERIEVLKNGILKGCDPIQHCSRYVDLPVRRVIKAMEFLGGVESLSGFGVI
ncbi:UNVERIFIED_CONTAM: hypothetical protein HDU68_010819 [Siphonaria sp. JEL0065]|nr:hypothetical protein HDU68_010819 [Siphonaria sp. JEL0065]